MAKKIVNSDIYNLSKLVDDVKSVFIPNETDETLAVGMYGYIGAIESHRLQTQVQMTGELCNEVFPSRARLSRNVITHAIMTNIEDINAIPAKMTAFLAIKEIDIVDLFDGDNNFIIDRECPIYVGDFEFHLEYDIKLKRIYIEKKHSYAYTAQYIIPSNRDVPTSKIDSSNQYLSPPAVIMVDNDSYIYLTVILAQVEHFVESKKLVTSNIIDNKTMNFEFDNQLAYFEVHCTESDQDYYLTPVFEGSSIPEGKAKYYCWYQYIDDNLIRVRFDRHSYMPGLNATVECMVKTCQGNAGNFTYGQDTFIDLESKKYGYKGITCLLTPVTNSAGGRDKKSKKELQSLIPKEALSRGSLTTITDLNNYFSMLDSEYGRIVIQKKADNQIERVYYAYFVAKDENHDIIPSNTVDIEVDLNDMIKSTISESDAPRYLLPSGQCFRLDDDGIARINKDPILDKGYKFTAHSVPRGQIVQSEFIVQENNGIFENDKVSCTVEIGDSSTPTHIFPAEGDSRYTFTKHKIEIPVEDYIQMGVGNVYIYNADYVTRGEDVLITAEDFNLNCFDIEDAFYTVNSVTRHFNKLPIIAYNIPANTKIHFSIKLRLNEKAKGIITTSCNGSDHKIHQKDSVKLSSILKGLGIEGEIIDAKSNYEDLVSVVEEGSINHPDPIIPPEPEVPDTDTHPYTLTVTQDEDAPTIDNRKINEWFYIVTDRTGEGSDINLLPFDASSDVHNVHVVDEKDLPPVGNRGTKDDWYFVVTERSRIDEEEIPEEIKGKEYIVTVLSEFTENVVITVTTKDDKKYNINLSYDPFNIENGIIIKENDEETYSSTFLTFRPVLTQNIWPENLNVGDQIGYKLRYKSIGNNYYPDIVIKLSRGLEYVPFSNNVTYPDKNPIIYEPVEISIDSERGFLYTNPYAVNVNGYRLYSAFYMMSMEENPYMQFEFINDKSNIQFISTSAYWTRPFYGNSNTYTLSVSITQSVQDNIGLINQWDDEATPLVKAVAVFYRDGKPYRYRSMRLTSFDPATFVFNFSQDFESQDIFDNDNNIKILNTQVIGQLEYKVTLKYMGAEYTIMAGGTARLDAVMRSLGITMKPIKNVYSTDRTSIEVYGIRDDAGNVINYDIKSFTDLPNSAKIIIEWVDSDLNNVEIDVTSTNINPETEYGFFNPTTEVKIYTFCNIPDNTNIYSRHDFDSICPGLKQWTLTNVFNVVNGVTMYHNYSEIMGSRVTPYGDTFVDQDNNIVTKLKGYKIKSVPMLGYDYCQDTQLVQSAINALNYRKAYIDNAMVILENSFGIDFKLFNTYGPSRTFYIIKDSDSNGLLNDPIEFIDKVNLTLNFRVKLVSKNDSYTKDNIVEEIKEYIEDLDDLSQLHIPNLVTQITTNYKEQISYFEYLGFNNYGAGVQHIYKIDDNDIPIHTTPEFLCVNNVLGGDGITHPDVNIFISEI